MNDMVHVFDRKCFVGFRDVEAYPLSAYGRGVRSLHGAVMESFLLHSRPVDDGAPCRRRKASFEEGKRRQWVDRRVVSHGR